MRPTHGVVRAGEAFGPYQLVKQLAVGGMAEIYLARATGISGFEKYVALKMIHPNFAEDAHFIDMLVEEAKIVVHLTQPNIVQIFDLGRIGDVHYIAMEFVDGLDLYHVLRTITESGELLDFDVVAYIALEVCAALDYAHRCRDQLGRPLGIIHRDISPQNILVSRAGEVKLADFGIAKATVRARQTAVGVIKGKYYYMSPEQAWGDTVDHRTDLFSTGVVLYESIVGQMLYLDEDIGVLLDKVRKADIAPPSTLRPDVPRDLEQIVLKAVSRRPDDRFQSAHDFQVALQTFLWSYAPNFTLGRVRSVVQRAIALEEGKRVFDLGGPGSLVGTAPAQSSERPGAVERLPMSSHSLLPVEVARTGEAKLASLPSWTDDFSDATMISDPPLMLAHLDSRLTGAPAPPPILPISVEVFGRPGDGVPDVGWDDAEETTTVVSRTSAASVRQGRPARHSEELTRPAGPMGLAAPPSLPPGRPPSAPEPGAPRVAAAPGSGAMRSDSVPVALPPIPERLASPPGPSSGRVAPASVPLPGLAGGPPPPRFNPLGPGGPDGPGAPAPVGSAPPRFQPSPGPAPVGSAPPRFQPLPAAASGPGSHLATDEADAVERRLERSRRQRNFILIGVGVCLVLIAIAVFIISARKTLEAPGSVRVESEPTGAKVLYRDRVVGNTPYRLDSLPIDEEHSVRLTYPGCESTTARLPVEAGKTKVIRVKLKNCDK